MSSLCAKKLDIETSTINGLHKIRTFRCGGSPRDEDRIDERSVYLRRCHGKGRDGREILGATQGNSKPERRNAFWSKVKVQEQPALVPSAAMTASANEPCPSLSAIMALKTSCSFSTTSTSV